MPFTVVNSIFTYMFVGTLTILIMEPINIDKELEAFKGHLEVNERTIFSAKFGDGKTYFLDEFKKKYSYANEENVNEKEKYYFITLYPVNYSVAENQDIFEYIKRDILFQLAKDGKLNPIDFEAVAKSIFTWENLKEVISFLISCMPKGEILNKILEKGEKFAKKYKEEQTTFQKYESWFTSRKGGLYEHDGYTELIIETLKYIKSLGYKTVLIIEDLDRIDPAHLFRILNVLGAHIDEYIYKESGNTNKFGFDNIITVFDYNVTENIFYHFYGENANYNGYINKFASHQPFFYSINEVAHDYLYDYINNECMMNKNTLRNINNTGFTTKLDNLSVRDIQKLIDDSNNQIVNQIYSESGIRFQTNNPLTKLISILLLIGMTPNEIKNSILSLTIEEKLNCVNSFLCIYPELSQNGITVDKKAYTITKSINNGIIEKLKIEISNIYNYSPSISNNKINLCIDMAFKYIKGI